MVFHSYIIVRNPEQLNKQLDILNKSGNFYLNNPQFNAMIKFNLN